VSEVLLKVRHRHRWADKIGNVMNYAPKSVQTELEKSLQDIWVPEAQKDVDKVSDVFL